MVYIIYMNATTTTKIEALQNRNREIMLCLDYIREDLKTLTRRPKFAAVEATRAFLKNQKEELLAECKMVNDELNALTK